MQKLLVILLLAVPIALCAQQLRIASYNMERLGQSHKDYAALARIVASFDVVAAEEVMNTRGPSEVMARLGSGWSDFVSVPGEGSRSYQEHFGFFYDDKVELSRDLGEYPRPHQFFRPPYAVQFRVKSTGFTFTLVVCHIIYGKSEKERTTEISHLGDVALYFDGMTGNKGTTILAGDFNEERTTAFASLADIGDRDMIPAGGTTMGARGPAHFYDHMFLPRNLQSRVQKADVDYWTTDFAGSRAKESDHFPVSVILDVAPEPSPVPR